MTVASINRKLGAAHRLIGTLKARAVAVALAHKKEITELMRRLGVATNANRDRPAIANAALLEIASYRQKLKERTGEGYYAYLVHRIVETAEAALKELQHTDVTKYPLEFPRSGEDCIQEVEPDQ